MRHVGKSRVELLETIDRPALKALPNATNAYAEWKALQPSALAECRKINSGLRIPSGRAIAGAKLHRDVLVAIRNPQWRPGYRIWLGGSRRSDVGASFAFPRPLRRPRRLRRC